MTDNEIKLFYNAEVNKMKLEEIKKGNLGKNPIKMAFASVRLPKETYDYIKANNISLRKLVVAAVEELKRQ